MIDARKEAVRLANEVSVEWGMTPARDESWTEWGQDAALTALARYIEANPDIAGEQRKRARELLTKGVSYWLTEDLVKAQELIRLIAGPEEVDPIILEARNLVECTVHWSPQTDRDLQSGKNDNTPEMKIAIAALRRGVELATTPCSVNEITPIVKRGEG